MNRRKFFVTAAFPYALPFDVNEMVTRLRAYVVADLYARYHDLMGEEVLFPMGFHYSGTPIVSFYESVLKGDEEALSKLRSLGIDPSEVDSPKKLADLMAIKIKQLLESLQVSPNWEYSFTTEDPGYKSFVKWILSKLLDKEYIIKGEYPVPWDPVEEIPVSHHDTKGFVIPKIGSYFLLLFEADPNLYFPAALRPELVFGVTNLWIHPRARYVEVDFNGKKFIVSEKAAFKLRHQFEGVVELGPVNPEEWVGEYVRNPITHEEIPILPSTHVDPNRGSGVVASVPKHNVSSYLMVKDLLSNPIILESFGLEPKKLQGRKVVEVEGEENLIEKLLRKYDPEEAERKLISIERSKGKIVCETVVDSLKVDGFLRGLIETVICDKPLDQVQEVIRNAATNAGLAITMYDVLNGPIYSRFGNEVVVKVLRDQWFLDYDNPKWKEETLEALGMSEFWPRDAKRVVIESVKGMRKRAFTTSKGMGTEWDGKIVDSLTDSTLYYLFYPLAPYLKNKELSESDWDYLILGIGSPSNNELKELRKKLISWMPLDLRIVYEGLLRSHVTYMFFHHAAILPPTQVPREVFVTGEAQVNQVDLWKLEGLAFRLLLLTKTKPENPFKSTDLEQEVKTVTNLINEIRALASKIQVARKNLDEIDVWLVSQAVKLQDEFKELLDKNMVREASILATSKAKRVLERYLERLKDKGLMPSEEAKKFVDAWSSILYPVLPSLAEEIGSMKPVEGERNYSVEAKEWYYDLLLDRLEDARGGKVKIKVAPHDKLIALLDAIEAIDEGAWEDLESLPKEIVMQAHKLSSEAREIIRYIDEEKMVKELSEELKRRLGIEEIEVEVDETVNPLEPKVEKIKSSS
ncbi:hypothetical protein EYM_02315 [Ignicoccus islandicus DSM 13165]|uniref:leucine--tRNA ligase n=1 Tax=Ignicoccus islandicus DSM 13165 TaxID=940295 RepID=A0A0U3FQX7_9CREN|nr:class I tRNA ligase family protein [Ignicoccus islandicus]ALU12311.1 hypothetical protein EYM_02315 [Ignicoccus islandicus DSM 13165]